ncbi:MAG: entericidin [Phycisphaerales bacterium JB050]
MNSQNQNHRTRRYAALLFAALGLAAAGLSACSTIEGAGEDLAHVGNSVSEASQDVQDDN